MSRDIQGQLNIFDFIENPEDHSRSGKPDYKGATDEITRYSIEVDFELTISLKKCECGGKPEEWFIGCHKYRVKCSKCGRATEYFKKAYLAKQAWNRDEVSNKATETVCRYSKHTCNKKELWKVADTLDEIMCPHVCCRSCNTKNCGARCNGSEEPQRQQLPADFPIRDREGWRPMSEKPEEDFERDLELQVLGRYRYNNQDKWSLCPASFDGSRIIALEVPFDIPRPDWKYWRIRPDKGISHDRHGREYKAPTWMDKKRCETCAWWEIYPVDEQPPAGWGVYGQCNCYHEPEMMKNGYWKTSKTSCCMDYKEKYEQETEKEKA